MFAPCLCRPLNAEQTLRLHVRKWRGPTTWEIRAYRYSQSVSEGKGNDLDLLEYTGTSTVLLPAVRGASPDVSGPGLSEPDSETVEQWNWMRLIEEGGAAIGLTYVCVQQQQQQALFAYSSAVVVL